MLGLRDQVYYKVSHRTRPSRQHRDRPQRDDDHEHARGDDPRRDGDRPGERWQWWAAESVDQAWSGEWLDGRTVISPVGQATSIHGESLGDVYILPSNGRANGSGSRLAAINGR